jgi:hypothetical protein
MSDDTRRNTRAGRQDDDDFNDTGSGTDDDIASGIWAMDIAEVDPTPPATTEDAVQRFKERLKRAARERSASPRVDLGEQPNQAY